MKTAAILVARLIFAFVFAMAAAFKFALMGMDATAAEIAGGGLSRPATCWRGSRPFSKSALALAFLTGLYFSRSGDRRHRLRPVPRFFVPRTGPVGAAIRWSSASSSTTSPSSRACCSPPCMGPADLLVSALGRNI